MHKSKLLNKARISLQLQAKKSRYGLKLSLALDLIGLEFLMQQ
jgi:hypothetical protein